MSGYFYSASPAAMRRRTRKPPPPKRTAAAPYYGPPLPPGGKLIDQLFPDMPTRTEPQWNELLDARVKPFINAIDDSTRVARAQSEFQFEQAQRANQGLSQAFLGVLTGGKTGAEAEQYAKENFGGQYLPAQAMSMAADRLADLTSSWDEATWKISGDYMKAMAEVPGIREQLRADIQNQDTNEYERRFKTATLLLDQAWNTYNAQAKAYAESEQRKMADAAIRQEQGLTGYTNRKDAVSEAAKFADDTGTIWSVKPTKGGWVPYDTKKKKPKAAGSKPSAALRNSALTEARDLTASGNTVWRVRKRNGAWEAYNTGVKKAVKPGKGGKGGLSDAQKAENDLTNQFYSDKEKYIGSTTVTEGITQTKGGMPYAQAFQQLYAHALAILTQYGRSPEYVRRWVQGRLSSLYPGAAAGAAKPRGG